MSKKTKKKIDKKGLVLVVFALQNILSAYEATKQYAKTPEDKNERKKLESDLVRISFTLNELTFKLRPYTHLLPQLKNAVLKILKGAQPPERVSNLEFAAALLVRYIEDFKEQPIALSKTLKDFIYEVDTTAFEYVDEEGDEENKHIVKAADYAWTFTKALKAQEFLELR